MGTHREELDALTDALRQEMDVFTTGLSRVQDELFALESCRRNISGQMSTLDAKTRVLSRAHSAAVRAIEFASSLEDAHECREFLQSWLHGDTSEWPEFESGFTVASLPR